MSDAPPPPTLHNTVGDTVAVVTDDEGNMRAVAPNGRLVVAAGQVIASAWGNTTYDQSMMTFANTGDRTNQWPVPNEGGLSYLMDSRTPWIYRNGAWHALPLGFLASATGPASATNVVNGFAFLASVAAPVVFGRNYRVTASANVSATTAAVIRLSINDDQGATTWLYLDALTAPSPPGSARSGNGAALYVPTSTKTATLNLQLQSSNGTTAVAANAAAIMIEDIGG